MGEKIANLLGVCALVAVGYLITLMVIDGWQTTKAAHADTRRSCEQLVELGGTDEELIRLICKKRGVTVPDRLNQSEPE